MSRITFVLRDASFFRFAEGIIQSLLERGHKVTLISRERPASFCLSSESKKIVSEINAQTDSNGAAGTLSFQPLTVDQRRRTAWLTVARQLRSYAYRISGKYQWADSERKRWLTFLPYNIQRVFHWGGQKRVEALLNLRITQAALAGADALFRPPSDIVLQLRDLNPDVVVATPVVYPSYSAEVDYLRAALMLGRPTAALVASWDHLTVRGVFPVIPDAVLVWSEAQIDEAVHIHRLPKDRITAVGAPVFDYWFSRDYCEPREVFCRRVGLSPARPYVVYAVSSPIVGDESSIAIRLASELASRAAEMGIQVLVRPHPNHRQGLKRMTESDLLVWPTRGVFAVEADQKRDYYNTLYHAAALVGLNTSVFLEAMILDKPCVSIAAQVNARAPTAHYQHLVKADCCDFVADETAAAAAIIDLLRGHDTKCELRRRFVKNFIRPRGLKQSAAEVAAQVIEKLCPA
jgi:hypothetical protein